MACAIGGCLNLKQSPLTKGALTRYERLCRASVERGRDSWGIVQLSDSAPTIVAKQVGRIDEAVLSFAPTTRSSIFVCRAEPTTEAVYEKQPTDIPPFGHNGWWVAHNGVIANDHELANLFQVKPKSVVDSAIIPAILPLLMNDAKDRGPLIRLLRDQVKGSFALAIIHEKTPHSVILATNYRPLFSQIYEGVLYWSSSAHYFQDSLMATSQHNPYTLIEVDPSSRSSSYLLWPLSTKSNRRALVVCSGGLDSSTVAVQLKLEGYEVALLHFRYNCRAEDCEVEATERLAKLLNCEAIFIPFDTFSQYIRHSRLTNPVESGGIVRERGGIASAEWAHEYVPCRNLIMLSIAAGFAEAHDYRYLALGNNLEESGAYADNESIFIDSLARVLPHATQQGGRLEILQPFGNMMKHEIVKRALELEQELGVPFLNITHSCYENQKPACGTCGPCYMRRAAHAMNGVKDSIPYQVTPPEIMKLEREWAEQKGVCHASVKQT